MRLRYQDVKSSNIKALAWEKQRGYVEFLNGRRFAYEMPLALFNEMKMAPSIGAFFSKHVKKACAVAWSGWRCSNSPCEEDATKQVDGTGQKFFLCDGCAKAPRFQAAHLTISPIQKDAP